MIVIRKIILTLCASVLLIPPVSMVRSQRVPAPEPDSYVLIEAETRTVLASKDAEKPADAGYLTKLMALLLIAEDISTGRYALSDVLTASDSVTGIRGAVVWLEPGDKMTVDELLKSVIIGNANDALMVLAEKSEGSTDGFVRRMNSEAFDLGIRDSVFVSPFGYPEEGNISTAKDIAVICSALSGYDFLTDYFSTWRDFVKDGKAELVNENTLARTYEGHIGFKAAHYEQTGYSIAEGARTGSGTVYISVVLGAVDEASAYAKAKELIKYGKNQYSVTATLYPDEALHPLRVVKGEEPAVEIGLRSQSALVIPKGTGTVSTVTVLPEYIEAPVSEGQIVGTAAFYENKTLLYECDIIAKRTILKLDMGYILKKMLCKLAE